MFFQRYFWNYVHSSSLKLVAIARDGKKLVLFAHRAGVGIYAPNFKSRKCRLAQRPNVEEKLESRERCWADAGHRCWLHIRAVIHIWLSSYLLFSSRRVQRCFLHINSKIYKDLSLFFCLVEHAVARYCLHIESTLCISFRSIFCLK